MYAVIRSGGKQYKVQAGDVLRLEKIEAELGSELQFTDILMVGGDKTFIGAPHVKDAKVTVVVTRQAKSPKVIVFKKKRRQGYRKLQGHRQLFTEVFVKAITGPEGLTSKAEKSAQVYDPAKKDDRMLRVAEWREKNRQEGGRSEAAEAAPKVAKAKKTVAKKAAAGKKKPAKKKSAGAKKTKTAKKKSSK